MSSVGVSPFLKSGTLALAGVVPASQLQRPAPPMAATSVAAVDQLTGGLPRGALSEICGPASSGRSSLLLAALAARTAAGEACALVDVTDSFDPVSAEAAGVDLRRVLWVRCGETFNHRGHGGRGGRKSQQEDVVRRASFVVRKKEEEAVDRLSVVGLRPPRAGKKSAEKSNVEAAVEAGVLQFDADHDHNAHHLAYEEVGGEGVVRRSSLLVREQEESVVRHSSSVVRKSKEEVSSPEFRVSGASCPLPNAKRETRNAKLSSLEQALRATDFLLQAGGFGMVAVDMGDVAAREARRIPLTSWFRFRRAVENTATVFVVVEREPFARQCASLVVGCGASAVGRRSGPTHARLIHGTEIDIEVLRAPGEKRPAGAVKFATTPGWAVRK